MTTYRNLMTLILSVFMTFNPLIGHASGNQQSILHYIEEVKNFSVTEESLDDFAHLLERFSRELQYVGEKSSDEINLQELNIQTTLLLKMCHEKAPIRQIQLAQEAFIQNNGGLAVGFWESIYDYFYSFLSSPYVHVMGAVVASLTASFFFGSSLSTVNALDKNKKQEMKGISVNKKGKIVIDKNVDVLKVTQLKLFDKKVTDISELSRLKNLTKLNLGFNHISSISALKGLTKLQELIINNNYIMSLSPLKGFIQLKVLNLAGNQVAKLADLKGLVQLEKLILAHNNFTDITALKGLSKLKELSIAGNIIKNKTNPLKGLVNLEALDVSGSDIIDLDFLQKLVKLKDLNLSFNSIIDLPPLALLTKLEKLNLKGNGTLNSISPLMGLTNLREVDLSKNLITDINPLLPLKKLRYLNLKGTFVSAVEAHRLWVYFNKIPKIDYDKE